MSTTRVTPVWGNAPKAEPNADAHSARRAVPHAGDDMDAYEGAVLAQEKLSGLLDHPFIYKKRIEALRKHASAIMDAKDDTREKVVAAADAAAKRIADGTVKEQETLALVGALFLSIAANTINEMPGDFNEAFTKDWPYSTIAYYLPDTYVWTSVFSIAFLTASIGCSVVVILWWNAQEDDDPYGDLVVFLYRAWSILVWAPAFCVVGLACLAANLYCQVWGYYFLGKISWLQTFFLGLVMYAGLIYLLATSAYAACKKRAEKSRKQAAQHTHVRTVQQPLPSGSVQVPVLELQEQAYGAESPVATKKRPKRNGSRSQLARTKSGSPTKVAALHADCSLPGEVSS